MFGKYQLKIYGSQDYVTFVSSKPLSFLSLFLHLPNWILITWRWGFRNQGEMLRPLYPFTIEGK